jgi:hypothetical protein
VIQRLSIARFKSVKALDLECRKVNVFIGAPDTGKTNILDALTFISCLGWQRDPSAQLRLNETPGFNSLFYRQFFDEPLSIQFDGDGIEATIGGQDRALSMKVHGLADRLKLKWGRGAGVPSYHRIRAYNYSSSEVWQYRAPEPHGEKIILPPVGENLLYIARHNSRVYDLLKETVSGLAWKLRFDQSQQKFYLSEVRGDEILDYNFGLLSDSLKRLFFYGAIMISSSDAVLVFDEPDVFAFPPYPKMLGEMVAQDASNQFFITTHNPYFLAGVVQKTPAEQLGLFVCSRDPEGATQVKRLSPDEVSRVVEQGASVFFNLDEFVSP